MPVKQDLFIYLNTLSNEFQSNFASVEVNRRSVFTGTCIDATRLYEKLIKVNQREGPAPSHMDVHGV